MTSTDMRDAGVVLQRAGARDAAAEVRRRIADTFQRCGDIDARRIHVNVDGDRATLTGTVTTALQRWAAEYATLDAPGIARVENRLVIWPTDDRR
jgi:osmotically-inducible protein OsmY